MHNKTLCFNNRNEQRLKSPELNLAINKFKSLLLICNNFNGVYSLTIIPTLKYGMSLFGMINFYCAIRIRSPVPGMNFAFTVLSVWAFVTTILLANITSEVWIISGKFRTVIKELIGAIQLKERRMYMSKEMKSLSPLRICIGGTYYMERQAKLTFMEFIVNGNINMLLTSK